MTLTEKINDFSPYQMGLVINMRELLLEFRHNGLQLVYNADTCGLGVINKVGTYNLCYDSYDLASMGRDDVVGIDETYLLDDDVWGCGDDTGFYEYRERERD